MYSANQPDTEDLAATILEALIMLVDLELDGYPATHELDPRYHFLEGEEIYGRSPEYILGVWNE